MPRKPVSKIAQRTLRGPRHRGHRGLVMVELALVVPLALIMVMATAELGRALAQYNALNKAVRDGAHHLARTAILGSTGLVQINGATVTETRNLVVYGNILGTGTPSLPGLAGAQITLAAAAGGSASLTASYTYEPIFMKVPTFGYSEDLRPAFTLQAGMVTRAL